MLPVLRGRPASATEEDTRRTLFAGNYFCLFLFTILNPVITSMRALFHVSYCRKMRQVSATMAITPGGCTFGNVECATSDPS